MTNKSLFVDIEMCIGCQACEIACKQENRLPVGPKWISIVRTGPVRVGDRLRTVYTPLRCMHCGKAPCIESCPVKAIKQRRDGIVLIDEKKCIGCKKCIEACPLQVPQFDSEERKVSKCTLCVHLVDEGLKPTCVRNCPAGCMYFGDVNEVARLIQEKRVNRVLRNL